VLQAKKALGVLRAQQVQQVLVALKESLESAVLQAKMALRVLRVQKVLKVLVALKEPLESAVLQAPKVQLVPEVKQISVSSMFAVSLEAVTPLAPAIQDKVTLTPSETLTTGLGMALTLTFSPALTGVR